MSVLPTKRFSYDGAFDAESTAPAKSAAEKFVRHSKCLPSISRVAVKPMPRQTVVFVVSVCRLKAPGPDQVIVGGTLPLYSIEH